MPCGYTMQHNFAHKETYIRKYILTNFQELTEIICIWGYDCLVV